MDLPLPPSFDPALLDMDNMTADKWYSLIYNRIVQQEDIFVGDFKKKVIEIINTCMNKPNTTVESLKQDITNTINESQFEFEHQKFIDGIVGGAYEYLCQFIIKNSMDNIRRTQCALNCFSLSNNLNCGTIKPYFNENILFQGSSKLSQIQCLPESNNNTTDTDKAIQSFIFNNNSENDPNSILMIESENIKNTIINKIETTTYHNYTETLQISNLPKESTNNIPTNNNENTAHSSVVTIDDDDKTTQAIISLAMKIQQTTFHDEDVDYFETNEINNRNMCINNEIQTTKCLIEQNGDQNTDPLKLEEEYKINNSLKLLESLVNIEHNKLEVQKSLVNNEPQSIIEKSEINPNPYKSSTKTNIGKKKSRKLQENIHKEDEEEWLPSDEKRKNHCSKNKTKTIKQKSHKDRSPKKNKKLDEQNTLNNSRSSSSSVEIQNDPSTSVTMNESLFSSYTKKPETIVSSVKNTKPLDTTCRTGTQLAYQNERDCLPINDLHLPHYIESIMHNEKKKCLTIINNSDVLSNKTSFIASTSGYNEKDVDNLKNKSTSSSGSAMKTSDYKKLYEKDRKSLFSPDVIIVKNVPSKPPKELINDQLLKKEYNSIQKKEDSEKKQKPKICKVKNNKRKKLTIDDTDKVKITDNIFKSTNDSKFKTNHASTSKNKFKRIKVTKSDDKANTNAVSNKNNKSNITDILENKVSSKIDTLDPQELNRTNILENNMSDEGTSEYQQLNKVNVFENNESINGNLEHLKLNGTNVLENKESDKDTLVNETMPEWLRHLYVIHNIKPCYIVIDRNMTY
ncbi:putative uncharacterized protein DDB_G0282133 [Rhopalosiphum padi]|uniref:putative uncharacterized protein DDB_G0282133 n=1 Tax=Rhopalosiphum padi TaxID=40932 RepID=UPI00298E883C|nr:putative uncharacterized protein DDB_G0282133 [Rhopalosiphum padi]